MGTGTETLPPTPMAPTGAWTRPLVAWAWPGYASEMKPVVRPTAGTVGGTPPGV